MGFRPLNLHGVPGEIQPVLGRTTIDPSTLDLTGSSLSWRLLVREADNEKTLKHGSCGFLCCSEKA